MPDQIRLGIIGASPTVGWAHRAHLPAVPAAAGFELTAACTTRMETAEESARQYGARMVFDDYHKMLEHPEIDAVAVVLRVPAHYDITRDAISAGKHVFTEWPLGRTTEEAKELAAQARDKGVRTIVGLQSRANPTILHMKELADAGYVGEILSCSLRQIGSGVLTRDSGRTWQREVELGANTLTISAGHAIDALRFVAGDFVSVSAKLTTQVPQWHETDTDVMVDVTSPDNILVNGTLENGAIASVHVASIPFAGNGLTMEIFGRNGTLKATSGGSTNVGSVKLEGAQGSDDLVEIDIPAHHTFVSEETPKGAPFNVGQMYDQFGKGILGEESSYPDFDTAVELHILIDAIRKSSDENREIEVGKD
ncbi:MAG TPA: Gfo/Idh/MocA family oxidoreductase [Dehalococcoidia bacterium]|nr:Gfo/Idh/MocA family oxidoreductase [Dehalococcoidia bacterium]